MKQVIFVCTGNTCRSPMAEVIAKSICKNDNINIFSRGLFVNENLEAIFNSINAVKIQNLSLDTHTSKQLTKDEIKNATLILTMSLEHKNIICDNFNEYSNKIYTLYEYVQNFNKDIKDPYGRSLEEYIMCFKEILNLIKKIDFDKI